MSNYGYAGPQRSQGLFTATADTRKNWSNSIWGDFPEESVRQDAGLGFVFEDDFLNFPALADGDTDLYAVHLDTGVIMRQLAEVGGVMRVSGNDADEDEGYLTAGGNAGAICRFTSGKLLCFEARVRWPTSVADGNLAVFFGLTAAQAAAQDALAAATGVPADINYVGFRTLAADGDGLDAVYNTSSGGGETIHQEVAQQLVANTWYKMGLKLDPVSDKVYFYADGLRVNQAGVALTATNFPNDLLLIPSLLTRTTAAAEIPWDIDGWKLGVLL